MPSNTFLTLIQSLIEYRFEKLLSQSGKLSMEEIHFDSLQQDFGAIEKGYIIRSYGKTDLPKLVTLVTDIKVDPKVLKNLIAPLGIFPFWEDSFDLSLLWNKMGTSFINLFQCNEIHGLNAISRKEYLYQVANYKIYKMQWNELKFYLAIHAGLFLLISSSTKQENDAKLILDLIKSEYQKQLPLKKIFPKLQIERPREFEIGKFLIPRTFSFGNVQVKSNVRFLRETVAKDAEEIAFWFGLSLTYEEKSFYLQYAFPHQKVENPDELQTKYQNLLISIIKPILATKWNSLSKTLQKYGSKLLEKPILQLFDKGILIEYELKINQTTVLCHVIVPKTFVDFLMALDTELKSYESSEPLLHFINLNRKLINEKYTESFEVYFHQTENRKFPILLFEFLNMISEADLILTIQNYFVASGIKTIELQKLFFYLKLDVNTGEQILFLEDDFDEKRIKSLLPPGMQKEWETFPVYFENRTGLASISLGFDEFIKRNREVMQSLFESSQNGKLDFSPQTKYVLYTEFSKLISEEIQIKLNAINQTNKGLFVKLKDVPKANVQQFFYAFKSDELGFIFLDWEEELFKIQNFVSKKFYQEVSEDLTVKKHLVQKSTLNLGVVLSWKEKFVTELTALTSEEFV
jgi:hypothetical protein